MATVGTNVLTISDWAKRLDPDGKVPYIVEMLSQTNEILQDQLWKEGNLPTGERATIRTGLPSVAWRMLNAGVQVTKSTTSQVDFGTAMLEAWSEVDKDLADLNGNTNEFRFSEAAAFVEAMNQEYSSTLFYGNSAVDPEEFTGLANYYSALSSANSSQNVVGGGGTTAIKQASIWLVCWGANGVYGIFPKGSKAGLMHEDLGLDTVETVSGVAGSRMRAYRDRFQWKPGLVVKDWRQAVRICNIEVPLLLSGGAGVADLTELMIKASHRMLYPNMGKCAWYMNRTVYQYLDIQRRNDVQTGGQLSYTEVDGKIVPAFRGWPIRLCDSLLDTEQVVTA